MPYANENGKSGIFNQELGITDDVDEENVCDFERSLVFSPSPMCRHLKGGWRRQLYLNLLREAGRSGGCDNHRTKETDAQPRRPPLQPLESPTAASTRHCHARHLSLLRGPWGKRINDLVEARIAAQRVVPRHQFQSAVAEKTW
jgi:hypothetical protein